MKLPLAAILGILLYVSESVLGWRRHSSAVMGGKSADGGTLRILWLTALLSIGAGLFVAYWSVGPRLAAGFPWRTMSLMVFASGMALRWWAIVHLGRFFTVDITVSDDHRVIDTGPYRAVRHPSYTGLLMQYVGWVLSLNSLIALPVVLVPIMCSLLYRIRTEEAALRNALGASYVSYCLRTKRLIPMVY